MTILVTGATGLLGNNLVRVLCDAGADVRALVRENTDERVLATLDVQKVNGDVRHLDQLREACRDVDAVIHCAAVVHIGWTKKALHEAVNVGGTCNVAQAAMENNARMVHVSSVDALGIGTREEPADEETPVRGHIECPYVLTKREAERRLLEFVDQGLDAVIVNPAYMLGPWDWKPSSGRMLLEVAHRFTPLAPPGGNNFCDVRDVAAGVLAALERGERGSRYILGGDDMTYVEAWNMFAHVSGSKGPRSVLGPILRWIGGTTGDLMAMITRRESDVNSAAIKIASLPHYFSSAKAERELGYSPRPAEDAARDAWQWFCENGYVKKKLLRRKT